ncbi:nucleobindin 1 isoform X1 [Arctopsyche grandis]|uniref:nucleobindin 1 isoform X1 n=1 Tax=Arctopsyche grandis TaxID=121162 RepID=UPI00406D91CD
MMDLKLFLVFACLAVVITAPPVTQKKPGDENEKDSDIKENLEDYMEYHRYLKEVVAALESDPEFREKLEKAEYIDIRTGKIAHELDFVHHNVRTKLDEIKRNELERLRHLVTKQFELTNNLDAAHAKIASHAEHLDHSNPHTFEIDDLKKLIYKTTADLEEADKKRRAEFKEYEMQKEFEKQQKLHSLDENHRKEYEEEIHTRDEKHKKHEPLHHPGSRQQLEEVWEKQDHMENQQFDPKIFFMLHDVDGNGVWDQTEVKALFLKELDKMYENNAPEDDMRERQEEMERMREHVFQESDTNKDGLISYEEFLVQTRRSEFEKDQGWKALDEQEVYSQQEYQEFERNRLEEVQRLIQQGVIPPHPNYNPGMQQYPNPNVMPPPHPGYQQQYQHQQPQPAQQQFHPNAIPQGQQYYPQNQQQFHQNAIPQGQPQYVAPQQQQQQYHPNAVPQGQPQMHPNQNLHGQQQHPNQIPQMQQHPNQNPQAQQHSNQNPQAQQHPTLNAGGQNQPINQNNGQPQQQNQQPQQHSQQPQQQNQQPQQQNQQPQQQNQQPQQQNQQPQQQNQRPQQKLAQQPSYQNNEVESQKKNEAASPNSHNTIEKQPNPQVDNQKPQSPPQLKAIR